MQSVTMYRSTDGAVWPTQAQAEASEALCAAVNDAMSPLVPPTAAHEAAMRGGAAYVRHDPARLLEARAALLKVAARALPYWAETRPELFNRPDVALSHNVLGRIISDCDGVKPLARAWGRLLCIDEEGREWEQPWYVEHPVEGAREA
jgi:hypothetical protein